MGPVYPIVGSGAHALKLMYALMEPDDHEAICMLCGDPFPAAGDDDHLCAACNKFVEEHVAAASAVQQIAAPTKG